MWHIQLDESVHCYGDAFHTPVKKEQGQSPCTSPVPATATKTSGPPPHHSHTTSPDAASSNIGKKKVDHAAGTPKLSSFFSSKACPPPLEPGRNYQFGPRLCALLLGLFGLVLKWDCSFLISSVLLRFWISFLPVAQWERNKCEQSIRRCIYTLTLKKTYV